MDLQLFGNKKGSSNVGGSAIEGVSKAGEEMVTYRRVQGGTPPNASWTRITVDEVVI